MGAAVQVRSDGLAEVALRREGAHDRVGVAGVERGEIAADDVRRVHVRGREDRRPDVAPAVDRLLAAVGAEHHRPVVRRLGDDRDRPAASRPVVGQVRQQLHNRSAVDGGGGHRLDPGVPLGQPRLVRWTNCRSCRCPRTSPARGS